MGRLIFLSAVNDVLGNLLTSAVGFSVMPGTDHFHFEVAEVEYSLQANCGA